MVWLLSVEWMFCHLWSGSAGEEEENTPACWGGGRGVQGGVKRRQELVSQLPVLWTVSGQTMGHGVLAHIHVE